MVFRAKQRQNVRKFHSSPAEPVRHATSQDLPRVAMSGGHICICCSFLASLKVLVFVVLRISSLQPSTFKFSLHFSSSREAPHIYAIDELKSSILILLSVALRRISHWSGITFSSHFTCTTTPAYIISSLDLRLLVVSIIVLAHLLGLYPAERRRNGFQSWVCPTKMNDG